MPRAVIWVVLGASAFAVTLSGAIGTALILGRSNVHGHVIPASFWFWLFAAACLLHHLRPLQGQRAIFAEIEQALRPGGLLFVHEINTRNVLFRFYMRVYSAHYMGVLQRPHTRFTCFGSGRGAVGEFS